MKKQRSSPSMTEGKLGKSRIFKETRVTPGKLKKFFFDFKPTLEKI